MRSSLNRCKTEGCRFQRLTGSSQSRYGLLLGKVRPTLTHCSNNGIMFAQISGHSVAGGDWWVGLIEGPAHPGGKRSPCVKKEKTPMLVLSRKVGERVVIGDRIVVTVLEVKGRQVRLGFEAPPDIQIWRGELSFQDHTKTVNHSELAGAQ